jgi:hypothetical protein
MNSSIWQKIRTFLVVSVLAVLVWVWADLAMTTEYDTGPLELVIRLSPEQTRLEPEGSAYVRLKLSGPQREIDWLKDEVAAKENPWRPTLEIPESAQGPQEYNLSELSSVRDLSRRGLKVEEIQPTKLKVDVDKWEEIVRPIEPDIDRTRLVPGSLQVIPLSAKVRVLSRDKDKAEKLNLRTERIALVNLSEGVPEEATPAIQQTLAHPTAGDIRLQLVDPRKVTVKFTILPLATATLENVPIGVAGPPDVMDAYKVVFGDPNEAALRQLKVKGKADVIKTLQEKRPEMLAYIVLSREDAKRTQQGQTLSPHKVFFSLPEGVELDEQPLDLSSVSLQKR